MVFVFSIKSRTKVLLDTVTASLRNQGESLGEYGILQIYSQTYYSDANVDNAQMDIIDYSVSRVQGHLYVFE